MADRTGQQLGNYRLVRLLGQGGFAEVYLGEHVYIRTQAAIKVLTTQLAGEDSEQFLVEATTLAHLEHPHIVRVLEFGVEGTTPFLVMSYAPGGTLRTRHPKGSRLPLSTVVSYVKQVASALQYAHDQKLVHRDVKPENMLLGRQQEVLLSDFGIALVAQTSRHQLTLPATGTVAYMAPEQIQGKPRPQSDQYSLGIIVYEWLSGTLPFTGSAFELFGQHLQVPPTPLREKVPSIPAAVEQVVMLALAKDPKERFGSVQAFATALEQATQVEPAETIPASHSSLPTELAPAPNESVIPTELVTPLSQSALPPTVYAKAPPPPSPLPPTQLASGSPPGSVLPPTVYVPSSPPVPTLPPTQRASVTSPPGTILYTYRGHSGWVHAIAWSPDGRRIASASDGVQVWEAADGGHAFTYGHSHAVYAVAWSPDGARIASGGSDKTVQVWDATTGQLGFTYRGHSDWVHAIAWSPDGTRIASGGGDKKVQVWDAITGKTLLTYRGHREEVRSVAWSPDGKHFASASMDIRVQVWDVGKGRTLWTDDRHYRYKVDTIVAWSPDGRYIAHTDGADLVVCDAATGKSILSVCKNPHVVAAVAWSPDSRQIACAAGLDKTVQVWNATTGKHLFTYRGHSDTVHAVAWSPDGARIVSGDDDKTVQVWQAP